MIVIGKGYIGMPKEGEMLARDLWIKMLVVVAAVMFAAASGWAAESKTAVKGAPAPAPAVKAPKQGGVPASGTAELLDLNTATKEQLMTLPGIGDAEADRIIACRPFLTKADLVTKKVLPAGPFLTVKDRVVAVQKSRPKASRAASGGGCG